MAGETATTGPSGAGRNSRTDMISMLTQLAPQLFGTGKQTTTTTGGKNITPEQLQALIGNMMSSNNGLASVLMPQRQAGLYNSPVNTLLAQQLTSRIAGDAAAQSTQETKTITQQTGASPAGKLLGTGLALLQGGTMAKSAWQNKDKIAAVAKDPAGALKELLGIGTTSENIPAGLEAVANTTADPLGAMYTMTGGFSDASSYVPQMDLSGLSAGMSYAPDSVLGQLLGGDGANAFEALLAPEAVKNLGAGAFEAGDTVLNISGGSDVADAVAGAGSSATDWIANTPGSEAADYLTAEGFGDVGMELADVGSSAASGIPYLNIGANLLDGNWDWGDTGSAIGSYFGGPIGAWVGSTIGEPVGEVVEGIGGAVGDALEGVGDFISDLGGGCFLTTACMVALSTEFKDDCRELEAMRAMRDGYMQTLDEGPQLIKEYYRNAPSYVAWINAREDAEDVWKHLYNDYIMPSVIAYEKQHFHKSYETYVRMVKEVERLVHEEEGV